MSLDAALNKKAEQNPEFQQPTAIPFISILNMNPTPVEQITVEPNPRAQNTDGQIPKSIPVVGFPNEIMFVYTNEAQASQSRDPAMLSSDGNTLMVVDEEVLQQYALPPALNESENSASPRPLIIDEGIQEAQLDYNQNVATIEVPLITDANSNPELVKFRPGVYEGDAIPPVYSDFSIFATGEDYEPQIPASIQPDMSIFPEAIYEEQVITENKTTNEYNLLNESDGNIFDVDNQERPPAAKNTQISEISEQPINSRLTGSAGGRAVDARLLITLRNTRLILIYKGYHFRRYYCQGLMIKWQCVDYECSAYLYSYENKITVLHSIHNHLGIIRKNYTPEKPTEPEALYSLEKATMTDPAPPIDLNADPSVLVASNMETMTLVETKTDETMCSSVETATQTSPPPCGNLIPSRTPHVLCSGHTIIPHDPSLEITVKCSSDFPKNHNSNQVCSDNTVTSLPDPLDYCVTSYDPISPPNSVNPDHSHQVLFSKYNYMSVPKDVPAKVTLTSIPSVSKPQVYYDGKLAQPATDKKKNSNKFSPAESFTVSSTNTVSTNALPANDITNQATITTITETQALTPNNSLNNVDGTEVPQVASHTVHVANQENSPFNLLRRTLSGYNPRDFAFIPRARVSALNSGIDNVQSRGISSGNLPSVRVTAPLRVLKPILVVRRINPVGQNSIVPRNSEKDLV